MYGIQSGKMSHHEDLYIMWQAVQRDAEDRWWALSTRGKSEHHRTGRRVIPGQGDLEESAAESRPPKVLDLR